MATFRNSNPVGARFPKNGRFPDFPEPEPKSGRTLNSSDDMIADDDGQMLAMR